MSLIENSIKVISANCQGLRNKIKQNNVTLWDKNPSIICLQDTNLTDSDIPNVKNIWISKLFLNGNRSNSHGVAILINNNFEHEILKTNRDEKGKFLNLLLKLNSFTTNLITLFGPKNDCPMFWRNREIDWK